MKKLLLLTLILLNGCSSYNPIYVPTPIIVKPKTTPLPKFKKLDSNATPSEYVKWCTVNTKMLYIELMSCRKQYGN